MDGVEDQGVTGRGSEGMGERKMEEGTERRREMKAMLTKDYLTTYEMGDYGQTIDEPAVGTGHSIGGSDQQTRLKLWHIMDFRDFVSCNHQYARWIVCTKILSNHHVWFMVSSSCGVIIRVSTNR